MKISRAEFLQLVAGGSAWLATSGFARPMRPAVADVARPLPLTAVRLTGGPLKHAQDLDAAYLLSLEPDRMLAFYRVARRARAEGARLHRLGRGRPAAHRAHRRPPSVGGQPDVGGDRRRPLQAARRLHRRRAEDRAGRERRRLRRRPARASAKRSPTCQQGQHPLGELRPERPVVALVHAAQDVRRPARRVPPHRQSHGARDRGEVRAVGGAIPRADERRADPADARHRVRRHERGDGRSLRRHRRPALARSVVPLRAQGGPRSAEARRGSAERPARQHAGAEADRIGGALRATSATRATTPPRRRSGTASSSTTRSPPAVTARTSTSASPIAWPASPTAAPPRRATSTTC